MNSAFQLLAQNSTFTMEGTFSDAHMQFVFLLIRGYRMHHIYQNIRKEFFLTVHLKNWGRGGGCYHIPEKLKIVKDSHHICWVTSYLSK